MLRYVPRFMKEWVAIWRADGFKALLRQKGWKVVAVVFSYYLVRDTFLYIIVPYLVINNIWQCQ